MSLHFFWWAAFEGGPKGARGVVCDLGSLHKTLKPSSFFVQMQSEWLPEKVWTLQSFHSGKLTFNSVFSSVHSRDFYFCEHELDLTSSNNVKNILGATKHQQEKLFSRVQYNKRRKKRYSRQSSFQTAGVVKKESKEVLVKRSTMYRRQSWLCKLSLPYQYLYHLLNISFPLCTICGPFPAE